MSDSGGQNSNSDAPGALIPEGAIILEKYRVERTLGIGGMGVVVLGTHMTLGNCVAVKFLLPQFAASAEASRRFVREAQSASRVASDHIVKVFDTGTSPDFGPYIVMEFLKGHDLSTHLHHSGGFSIESAIDFTVQAAQALGEAHAAGVIHRDVKPANLFLAELPNGEHIIKVLDFGISKVAEDSSMLVTKTSAVLGSGLYMSPEQMKVSKNVDHRTDIYALGVTLYELLAGTQPFTADSFAELAIKVNMEPPADLRQFRADAPRELAAAIERAFAKRPEERYQSMGEFALALKPWAAPRTGLAVDELVRVETRRGRAPAAISTPPPKLSLDVTAHPEETRPSPTEGPAPKSATFGVTGHVAGDLPAHLVESKSKLPWFLGIGAMLLGTAAWLGLSHTEGSTEPASGQASAQTSTSTAPVVPGGKSSSEGAIAGPSGSASVQASASSNDIGSPPAGALGPRPSSAATSNPPINTAQTMATPSSKFEAPPHSASAPRPPPTAPTQAPTSPVEPPKTPCGLKDLNGHLIACPTP